MKKNTTIKDIAKALDIHHTTVSRALRGHPYVNEDTKKLVLETAEKMKYFPNAFASGLRSNTSKIIGIMVPDIRPHFFSQTISCITNLAFKRGYTVMICQSNEDYEVEKQNALALLKNRVAGVIASISYKTKKLDHFETLEKHGIPVVYFDRVPQSEINNCVKIDNFNAGMLATDFLISKGKKNIVFYAGLPNVNVFAQRLSGFKNALDKNGITLEEDHILFGGIENKDGIKVAEKILGRKNRPDAIICIVDAVALGILNTMAKSKIKVPEEIAIVGFDNDPAGALVYPGLTTLAQPMEEIAGQSFNFLCKRIAGEEIVKPSVLNMELIIRESA
jgi:DNA-binding LacI/PurR family transcriptional regulator